MRVNTAETTRSPTRLLEGGVPGAFPLLAFSQTAGKEGDWKGVGEVAGVTSLRGGGGAVRTGRRRRLERVRATRPAGVQSTLSSAKCLLLGWSELEGLGSVS